MSYPRECRIGSMVLSPPWTNASGFIATPPAYRRFAEYRTGGVVGKTVLLEAKPGHESPVFVEGEDGSFYNAIGLACPGAEEHAAEMKDVYPLRVSFIESVASENSSDEVRRVIELLKGRFEAAELNVSCPNVSNRLLQVGQDPGLISEYTMAAKEAAGRKSLIVKLTPNIDDITLPAMAAASAGADALLIANTYGSMYINPHTGEPHLTNKKGGKSGRNIMGDTLRLVDVVARLRESGSFDFKIGGVGGISCSSDVRAYFDAGADYVQFGTHLFLDRPMEMKRATQPELETVKEFLERMEMEIYGGEA